jgi:hypothetical protein
MTLQIIIACLASGGLFSFLQYIISLFVDRKKKPSNENELLLALAHDRIIFLCRQAIEKKSITQDEYDNILQLYNPYREAGGNHLTTKYFSEVEKLPIKD